MRFSLKLSVLIFLLLNSILLLSDEVLVDSVYFSSRSQIGAINNYTIDYSFQVNNYSLKVGDSGIGWIPPTAPNATFRAYLSFNLSELNIDNNYELIELVLWTGIEGFNGIYGNDVNGEWPEWDVTGGDTLKLWVDHVDFGDYLDVDDWTAGDPENDQTIETKCTYISEDNYTPETGFVVIDITDQVLYDLQLNRELSQFRLRFDIETDYDNLYDTISFNSTLVTPTHAPQLNCYYTETNNEEPEVPELTSSISNYPNPFNPQTTINYSLTEPGNVQLQIYNTKGQLIETLLDEMKEVGNHAVEWNAENQASGIYLYRITSGTETKTGRCLLLK